MHKIISFPEKINKIRVLTLPKIFIPVTRNMLIFFIWPESYILIDPLVHLFGALHVESTFNSLIFNNCIIIGYWIFCRYIL